MAAVKAELGALRAELAAMRVLPCGLRHEQVRIGAAGVLRRAAALEHDPGLERTGLCPREVRARQLSCAHTRARATLERAIAAAAAAGLLAPEQAQCWRAELGRLEHAIHMTDWDKSRAEVQLALALERGEAAGPEARGACAALSRRHTRLGTELAALQGAVLALLGAPAPSFTSPLPPA